MAIPSVAPPAEVTPQEQPWWIYMVRCHDGSLYTGATIDVPARVHKHATGRGAKYTKTRTVTALAFYAWMPSKRAALSAEARLKRWPTAQKRALVAAFEPILL